jgi:hypothetical protein
LRTVVSVGDVVLAAGIGLLVSTLMLRPGNGQDPGVARRGTAG